MLEMNLGAPGAWQLKHFGAYTASPERLKSYKPRTLIDPFGIPIIFNSHIIAIRIKSLDFNWRWAGSLIQVLPESGIADPEEWDGQEQSLEGVEIDRHSALLNHSIKEMQFKQVSADLRLVFEPRPWLPRFTMAIWEFNGALNDSTEEKIDAARSQLTTIDHKVDELLAR